ncbi:hypothetical protein ACJRO7_032709 [Eucalyptus globulus]|uniref:ASCH domain-containing protein n=1 Tax=Eucalyptus globulus TaxID=34317 RepID=A0ABD3JKH8_EUCGL
MQSRNQGNYRNPCLTMHQPWASLLVHGIKRIEGRSWPAPIRGCLWIHATSKVPDESTIKAMEEFYREIYAVNGITQIKFPEDYPVSRLQGCVEVVGCVPADELACWNGLPEGMGYTDLLLVMLEAQTDYCWLCEQILKVYNLEKKRFDRKVNKFYSNDRKIVERGENLAISDAILRSKYKRKYYNRNGGSQSCSHSNAIANYALLHNTIPHSFATVIRKESKYEFFWHLIESEIHEEGKAADDNQ